MSGVAIAASDILKEGRLVKQSRYMKEWRQRHFVLTQQFLCSFKAQGDYRSPTEVIRLSECSTVKSCEDEIGKENAFKIEANGTVFHLIAESNAEKEAWIGHIGRLMVRRSVMTQDVEDFD